MGDSSFDALPVNLVTHVSEALGESGKEWLKAIPELIEALEREWHISTAEPFSTIEFNFVAPAVTDGGEQVVIKLAPPYSDGEFYSEAAYLRHREGRGCVRLLRQDWERRAILIERAEPGQTLVDAFAEREPDAVQPAIEVLQSITSSPPPDTTDAIVLDRWFDNLLRALGTEFPQAHVEKALILYQKLAASRPVSYLHGDFHPGNVVTAKRAPYLAIDPKGIIGGIGYEAAVFLNNFHWWQADHPELRPRLETAVDQFAEALEMSAREVREWAFVTRVLGAWWTFDEMPALYTGGVAKADIWGIL